MEITWFGHSLFRIVDSVGRIVVCDPFDESVGYKKPKIKANVLLISHEHYDHNNARAIQGKPTVIRGPGLHRAAGLEFKGIPCHHDAQGGRLRGENTIFCFSMDGIRLCHLGDLGHILSQETVREIGPVDVLFVPVGGIFTLDARGAHRVVDQLSPKIAIPMHYQTRSLSFDLEPVDRFLQGRAVEGPEKSLCLSRENLAGEGVRTVLMDYISA
ncbi:MAG: MBL fold metallo-hydrolase [Methanosarcinales archaeon]|nr:MBL fold metallo-hydrolase [Methanosarcinales archaeon]